MRFMRAELEAFRGHEVDDLAGPGLKLLFVGASLVARGVGITNLVRRATARASELSREELREGGERLRRFVAALWVVPNPSGLNAHETVATLAAAYAAPAAEAGVILP
jgi:TDG/mug DNA glycosylase family protein